VRLLKYWDRYRKELAHMLHSRRKAEIEVLVNAHDKLAHSGQPLLTYLVNKISLALDECNT
jgi:hypothetical protein